VTITRGFLSADGGNGRICRAKIRQCGVSLFVEHKD
jgi:hypothetical protein